MGNGKKTEIIYIDPEGSRKSDFFIETKKNTKQNHIITQMNGRPVEILQLSEQNDNFTFNFNHEYPLNTYYYKTNDVFFNNSVTISSNNPQVILIPQKYNNGTINLTNNINLPINGFIDPSNLDPLKIFLYNPRLNRQQNYQFTFNGNTDYLNTFPMPNDADLENLLLCHEIKYNNRLSDGPVSIDQLPPEVCQEIVDQMLGPDVSEQIDEEKAKQDPEFWTYYRGIKVGTEASYRVGLNYRILKDFGTSGRFYVKTIKGRQYEIFKGYSGLRKWYTSSRYLTTNPKVVSLGVGKSLKGASKGNIISLLIIGAVDIAEWMLDENNEKEVSDLAVTLTMDTLKYVISTVIATGIVALVLMAIGVVAASAPVCLVVGGVILVSILVGLALDWIDHKLGITTYLQDKVSEGKTFLGEAWDEHVVHPLGRLLWQMEETIKYQYLRRMDYGF
jgi:hypothetical protein